MQRNFESRQRAEQVRVQAAGRASSSPCSRQRRIESRQRTEQVRVHAAGRASSSPCSRQRRIESRQRTEQVQVHAAGREGSSPGSGQSRFESGNRQISRNQETQTRASPQRVVYPSIIQRKVSTCSIHANLHPNLKAEVASPESNTANMSEYISESEALKMVAPFKY